MSPDLIEDKLENIGIEIFKCGPQKFTTLSPFEVQKKLMKEMPYYVQESQDVKTVVLGPFEARDFYFTYKFTKGSSGNCLINLEKTFK